MKELFHSVTLDETKCKGCINCMKRCPTEAIRVRNGMATIISERCIDCGECIRICPNHAKRAVVDDFDALDRYKWKIALPPPSFYGQLGNISDVSILLTALKRIGFDDVFEVARAAEIVTHLSRKKLAELRKKTHGPIISSACPVVMRLIRVRFPGLCENILPVKEPIHLAAQMAREEAMRKTGLKPEEIGVFFLTPCPAKVTSAKAPLGLQTSHIDGALSVSRVCLQLLPVLKTVTTPDADMSSGRIGVNWAITGGESSALLTDNRLAADGIENIIKVLEEIEDDKLNDLDFVELNACPGGCVGGVLTVENPFVARSRLLYVEKAMPEAVNWDFSRPKQQESIEVPEEYFLEETLVYEPPAALDEDRRQALLKRMQIEQLVEELPSLDCGACGAPTCRALAEDIVRGTACKDDCVMLSRVRNVEKEDDT